MDRSGNRVPFSPRNLFAFRTERAWRSGLRVAAGARYTCTQFASEDNAFKILDHWVFDAGVSYRTRGVTLRLLLRNLADQAYFTRGLASASVLPASPFAFRAGVQLAFGKRP
jgi:outer membrane receptor for monomeric catechols